MTTIYPYPWPIGTCHFRELPPDIAAELSRFVVDGVVMTTPDVLTVHMTPTEGPYISFAGWKIRASIEATSPSTWIIRLA